MWVEVSFNDMKEVENYVKEYYVVLNDDLFGFVKGKNVIYIYLESF